MLPLHITPSSGRAEGPTWALHTGKWATLASCSKHCNSHCCTSTVKQVRQVASGTVISSASFTVYTCRLPRRAALSGSIFDKLLLAGICRTDKPVWDLPIKARLLTPMPAGCKKVLLCRGPLQNVQHSPTHLQAAEQGYFGGSALDNQKMDTLADAYKELRAAKREATKAAKVAEKAAQVSRAGAKGSAAELCMLLALEPQVR